MIFNVIRPYIIIFIPLLCINTGTAAESIAQRLPGQDDKSIINPNFNILAIFKLTNITINGFKASELSGLAWDNDETTLYALSDNGHILHLNPVFKDSILTDILLTDGYSLQDSKGNQLKWKKSDSEGLAINNGNNGIKGDSEILVCFERHPRIIKYKPDGTYKDEIILPAKLQDIDNYQSENRSLEAITIHPDLGILIGSEQYLNKNLTGFHNIFNLAGDLWEFPASKINNSSLSDLTMFENGDLLTLERGISGIWPTFEFALQRISLKPPDIQVKTIALYPANNEIFNDNFEGITQYKNDYFFMVSDDNNHPFKRTILVYFRIIE